MKKSKKFGFLISADKDALQEVMTMVKETNVAAILLLYAVGMVSVFAITFGIRALMDHISKDFELQEDAMEGYVL